MSLHSIDTIPNRRLEPELMDQPGLDAGDHVRALQGLRRINLLSRSDSILWSEIARLARQRGGPPVRVLDLATGGGDIPIALARRAARAGLNVEIDGCDISVQAVQHAQRQAAAQGVDVRFFALDALADHLPPGYDVVSCSLFLHHLDESNAINLLQRMAEATERSVLVNDLVRSRRGYAMALVGCHVLTSSRVVRADGPASVAAAFTPSEGLALAERAGLRGATITRHWPHRFLLSWNRR
jgi:2-polyprenyl-3-methyl-5-hydroxy-6-metoxy-1,4-benzoquinol methylase